MSRCGNAKCNKSLGIFRRSKRCLICNTSLCKNCFIREQANIGKYILRGHCLNCFMLLNEDSQLPQLPPGGVSGMPLPSQTEVISM